LGKSFKAVRPIFADSARSRHAKYNGRATFSIVQSAYLNRTFEFNHWFLEKTVAGRPEI
jgi:hypothetical protein